MTAPTDTHERRVADLEALAILNGHLHELAFPGALRPDVARIDHLRGRVFVADSKHSESAGASATARRFAAYLQVAHFWSGCGYEVTVAIAHTPQDARWLPFLHQLCDRLGLEASGSEVAAPRR